MQSSVDRLRARLGTTDDTEIDGIAPDAKMKSIISRYIDVTFSQGCSVFSLLLKAHWNYRVFVKKEKKKKSRMMENIELSCTKLDRNFDEMFFPPFDNIHSAL